MEKIRRRQYLIDKRLQLRFTALVVMLVVVYSVFLAGATYVNYKISCIVFDNSSLYDPAVEEAIQAEGRKTVITTTIFLVVNGLVVAGVFILLTHKVAGPLYRIRRQITDVRDGKLPSKIVLRKNDELGHLADSFNEMTEALRDVARHDMEDLKALSVLLDKAAGDLRGDETKTLSADLKQCVVKLNAIVAAKEKLIDPTGGQVS